jgi:hypothetical protein
MQERIELSNYFDELTFNKFKNGHLPTAFALIADRYIKNIAESMVNILIDNNHPQCFVEDAWEMYLDEQRNGPSMIINELFEIEAQKLAINYIKNLSNEVKMLLWLSADNCWDELYSMEEEQGSDEIDNILIINISKCAALSEELIARSITQELYHISEKENDARNNMMYDIEDEE